MRSTASITTKAIKARPPIKITKKVITAMFIWRASLKAAVIGSVLGWAALFVAALLGVATYAFSPEYVAQFGLTAAAFTLAGLLTTFWADAVKDRHKDLSLSQARSDAAQAMDQAILAQTRLKDVNEDLVKVSERILPRRITKASVVEVKSRLDARDWNGVKIQAYVAPDIEAYNLAMVIANAIAGYGIAFSLRYDLNHLTASTVGLASHAQSERGAALDEVLAEFGHPISHPLINWPDGPRYFLGQTHDADADLILIVGMKSPL